MNDLIYGGVENITKDYGARSLHLSPATREEGLAYLEHIFRQMETPGDSVRCLLIMASTDNDAWLSRRRSVGMQKALELLLQ